MGFNSIYSGKEKDARKLEITDERALYLIIVFTTKIHSIFRCYLTLKKPHYNLFVYINILLVFSYFNKSVSLCKSCYSP